MRIQTVFSVLVPVLSALACAQTLHAQGTAFTYQGRLNDGTNAATGSYDLTFTLFSVSNGVGQVGSPLTNAATAVSNGLFTVTLDFGNQFPGASSWLEIGVRSNGVGTFQTLTPRQQLTPTPYAIYAESANAGGLIGTVSGNGGGLTNLSASQLTGTISSNNIAAGSIGSAQLANGSIVNADVSPTAAIAYSKLANASAGQVLMGNGSGVVTATTLSGDATVSSAGVMTVANGAITSAKIADGTISNVDVSATAAIADTKLGTISTAGKVADSALSANVALLNRSPQNFAGQNTFAGNVGIGTTTPGFPLNLATVLGDKIALYGNSGSHYGLGIQAGLLQIHTDVSGSDVAFGYGQSSAMTETMRITGNGNVGIGTSSPAAPLHVINSGFPTTITESSSTVGTWAALQNTSAGGQTWQFISTGPGNGVAGNLQLGWGPTPNSSLGVMTLRTNGNVGIGTTTPAQALDVNGNISLSGTHVVFDSSDGVIDWGQGGVLYFRTDNTIGNISGYDQQATLDSSGNFTCAAINITSDRNAKEDFKSVNPREVLDKVAALPITEWQYKKEKARNTDAVRHIGPMAQDFSEAFALGHDDKHISVVDEGGVALAAIQGLNQKLESKVQDQSAQISELRHTVSDLQKLVGQMSQKLAPSKPQ